MSPEPMLILQQKSTDTKIGNQDEDFEIIQCEVKNFPHLNRVRKLCQRVDHLWKDLVRKEDIQLIEERQDGSLLSEFIDQGYLSIITRKNETAILRPFLSGIGSTITVTPKDDDLKKYPILISFTYSHETKEPDMDDRSIGAGIDQIILCISTCSKDDCMKFDFPSEALDRERREHLQKAVSLVYERYLNEYLCLLNERVPQGTTDFENGIHKHQKETRKIIEQLRQEIETAMKSLMNSSLKDKKEMPKRISDALKSLKVKGVVGYGHFSGNLRIDVDNKLSHDERKSLTRDLQELVSSYDPDTAIHSVNVYRGGKCTKPGDKLFINDQNTNRYGTIGTYAKYGDDVAAITCNHCVISQPLPYVDLDGKRTPFVDIIHSSEKSDFAALKVHRSLIEANQIDMQIRSEDNIKLKSTLHKDRSKDLSNCQVFKRGATSGTTEGRIRCNDYNFLSDDDHEEHMMILVAGMDDRKFLEPGDSGSIVYKMDNEDPLNERIDLISICQGGDIESRLDGSKVENILSMTHRLDTPVNQTEAKIRNHWNFASRTHSKGFLSLGSAIAIFHIPHNTIEREKRRSSDSLITLLIKFQ
ncbi:hypothetical protein FSP39_013984 [Pinctada imbricata]|uniref:Uncharacterized protein n=1 Tax=Pinctada imbricata TaxID=66713 RepID=A0AA88XNH9_PINIB|nr:hypothetical protein FSP39_013984 [Pinctada imbricata]